MIRRSHGGATAQHAARLLLQNRHDSYVGFRWESFNMLRACAAHRPLPEIAALASTVRPQEDPEVDYFFASHLAYCGQTGAALQLLKRAIQGNYCSYPAIDSDRYFVSVRAKAEFAEIRSAAIACQEGPARLSSCSNELYRETIAPIRR